MAKEVKKVKCKTCSNQTKNHCKLKLQHPLIFKESGKCRSEDVECGWYKEIKGKK